MQTQAQALADPASSIHRKLAAGRAYMQENERRIAVFVSQGMTREQAWTHLLQELRP